MSAFRVSGPDSAAVITSGLLTSQLVFRARNIDDPPPDASAYEVGSGTGLKGAFCDALYQCKVRASNLILGTAVAASVVKLVITGTSL
jgi:hypothetical protein